MQETTTIRLSMDVKERLESLGKKGETFQDLIVRLLDVFEKQHKSKN